MMIGLLFQQLYNTVDTLVVGRFVGAQALAAVGNTGSIINTFVGLCAGLSGGAGVIISQAYGAHDERRLSTAVHTTIAVTLILSVLATALSMLLVDPLLHMMAMPEDVYEDARLYLMIYFAGFTGLLIYNMGSGILRAVGDSRRPLYFLVFSAIVNTVLDLLFVVAFHMGVKGVALATIIAQMLSGVLVLVVLTREPKAYGIRWKKLSIDRQELRRIMSVGLPSGFQQGLTSFSNVFVQSYINAFGSTVMAGWSVYNKLDAFVIIPSQSISLAATTFVGQNYGAGNLKRAREGVHKGLIYSLACTLTLGAVMMLASGELLHIFTADSAVVEYGNRFIRIITPFYIVLCFSQIYAGALRGIGEAKIPMIEMLASYVAFRQVYLYVTKALGFGFNAVALAYPMGWVLCTVLLAVSYHRSCLCREEKSPFGKKANRQPETSGPANGGQHG